MGTLSKAYGCIGGFVATEAHIANILRIGCSAFGFTSTLPPDQAAAVLEAIDMVRDEPERRQRLWDNQRYFVRRMRDAGFTLLSTETPIVPLHVGDEAECARVAAALRAAREFTWTRSCFRLWRWARAACDSSRPNPRDPDWRAGVPHCMHDREAFRGDFQCGIAPERPP